MARKPDPPTLVVEDSYRAAGGRMEQLADEIATTGSGVRFLDRCREIASHKGYRCGRCLGPLFRGRCRVCR